MGAWGYGILDNDTALDGLGEVMQDVEAEAGAWAEGGESNAARLAAAVGLLREFSPYSFDAENPFPARLTEVLRANQPYFDRLPVAAREMLTRVLNGDGPEVAEHAAGLPPALKIAFYGDEGTHASPQPEAPTTPQTDLFRHPDAAAWAGELAGRLATTVDEGLEDDDVVYDLAREGEFMGAFAVLCFLGPDVVDRAHFARWQARIHAVMAQQEPTGDDSEDAFTAEYYRLLDVAFAYVLGAAEENTI